MSNPKILCLPPVANTLRDLDMRFTWVEEGHSASLFIKRSAQTGAYNTHRLKPRSHCDDVATVHPDAGQPVYRDAPGHIS